MSDNNGVWYLLKIDEGVELRLSKDGTARFSYGTKKGEDIITLLPSDVSKMYKFFKKHRELFKK